MHLKLLDDGHFEVEGGRVRPEWIDYNGHMNVAYYVLALDQAVDIFFEHLGFTEAYRQARGRSFFAVESHVTWQRELHLDDPLRITAQLLGYDDKRMHTFYRMYHAEAGYLAATSEWMQVSVDLTARRSAPWEAVILERLESVWRQQRHLPRPPEVGRVMQLRGALQPAQSSSG